MFGTIYGSFYPVTILGTRATKIWGLKRPKLG